MLCAKFRLGHSEDCPALTSGLYTDNLWIGQVFTHALLLVWHVYVNRTMAYCVVLEQQTKISFLIHKGGEQIVYTLFTHYLLITFNYVMLCLVD